MKRILGALVLTIGAAGVAHADIKDAKFGTAQMFDVQWNLSGDTLNTSSYNYLYRSEPSASRMTASDYSAIASAGQYFQFFDSTTVPGTYGMALYNSDGSLAEVIHETGSFRALGDDAIFYNGNGSWGTLITTGQGYDIGDSASFTTMDTSVSADDLTNHTYTTTEPLADGETASSGPSSPTVVSTAAGTPTVTTSESIGTAVITTVETRGTSVAVTEVDNAVSETATEQTWEKTTTVTTTTPVTTVTTTTTPVTTTTCTTPTTVTTYSDGTTTTTDGTTTCSDSTTDTATDSSETVDDVDVGELVDIFAGRIDQMSTITDITRVVGRGLSFEGANGISQNHEYANGMQGDTKGFTIGHKVVSETELTFGFGLGMLNTSVKHDTNSASADTIVANLSLGRQYEKADFDISLTHMKTDYSYSREIGANAHSATSEGADTNITAMITGTHEKIQPVVGVARGKRTLDGYTETGPSITARTLAATTEYYTYGIVGGRLDFGLPYVEALRYTDGINQISIGLSNETGRAVWAASIARTETDNGTNDDLQLSLKLKW